MSSDKTQPLVTVYMPTYNRVELLQRAVESVLKQDYRNIELIVVDDNSTDGTHEYLAKMTDEDPRFKYFINEKNSGACVSRNKAIFVAKGEFITGLDDDDYLLPHHISSLVSNRNKLENECIAIYSNTFIKKENGLVKLKKRATSCRKKDLIVGNCIGNQIFTKTDYLKQIGGFDDNLPAWQDLECWYRLLKHFNSKAISINVYSHIYDISHPHERITNKKISSIYNACSYFVNKHQLTLTEKNILELQLLSYSKEDPKVRALLRRLIYQRKPYNAIETSITLLSLIKRKYLKNLFQNMKNEP